MGVFRGSHAADDQDPLGAGDGDVQQIPVFLLLEAFFRGEQRVACRAAFVLAAEHREVGRRRGMLRPVAQHADVVARRFAVVGVEQDHDRRFQPLGAVDGHDAHRVQRGIDPGFVGGVVAGVVLQRAQRIDEFRQARIAAGIEIQRQFDEGFDIPDHLAAHQRLRGLRGARDQLALMQDNVEQVVHRQLRRDLQPVRQQTLGAHQRLRCASVCDGLQTRPPAMFGALRQRNQVGVAGVEQRRLQHVRQRQIVAGRDQEVQQRDQIEDFQRA